MGDVWKPRVRMTVSGTPGTGTITLNAAVDGKQAFPASLDGLKVDYAIEDGNNWEEGVGTYTHSGTTLTRDTVHGSSNAGAKISATSAAEVFLTISSDTVNKNSKKPTRGKVVAMTGGF